MIGLLVRRSKREVRASYCGDEEKDVGEERNCNTYRTVENRNVLRKIMGLTHMLGHSIPPVGHDRTLRNRAEQFPFIDSEGHFRAGKFKRNRSNMEMPGMFPSRNATGSKAIRDWALVRDIRLVKSGHGFNMERKNSKEKA